MERRLFDNELEESLDLYAMFILLVEYLQLFSNMVLLQRMLELEPKVLMSLVVFSKDMEHQLSPYRKLYPL